MDEISVIAPLGAVIALGWVLRVLGIVSIQTFREDNRILFWLSIPALLLRLTAKAHISAGENLNLFLAVHVSFVVFPMIAFLAGYLFREEKNRLAISTMVSIRSNQVFMGIPAISIAMGSQGLEAISVFLAMSLIGYHIFSISSSQLVLSGGLSFRSLLDTTRKVLKNPMVLACLCGVGLSAAGIHEFPQPLDTTLKVLGDIGTGLALLSLGAGLDFTGVFSTLQRTWRDAFIKLVLHPAFVLMLFSFWPVERTMMQAVLMATAMPVAVNSLVVAQGMGMDDRYAGELIAVTTLLSMGTLPAWMRFLGI